MTTKFDPSRPTLGVLGLIRRGDEWLMIQRARTVRAPLAWCFPGGTIEPGESQETALIREMHEELSVDVEPGGCVMTQTKHDGGLILYCWSARILRGTPTPNPREIADVRWLSVDAIREMPDLLPGTMEILEAASSRGPS